MGGNALLLVGVAALAIYTGVHWERARRAVRDLELGRRRVNGLKQAVTRERGHVAIITVVVVLALYVVTRYG
ncbi:hypothetical protein ETD83_41835 [Actinomadura soli]|uniref:Uncharacterized protein n=1 Tax=Actinomadura soli TaxID=2508997 RepID=A0A5C4IYN8_9ACTN|nr:hypothetical protein [Actinomadura soli]TMQ80234.1 hypothetical protein ETD83_41835 [Actinomadura soli]